MIETREEEKFTNSMSKVRTVSTGTDEWKGIFGRRDLFSLVSGCLQGRINEIQRVQIISHYYYYYMVHVGRKGGFIHHYSYFQFSLYPSRSDITHQLPKFLAENDK
jgi:hypothetical protein